MAAAGRPKWYPCAMAVLDVSLFRGLHAFRDRY
jgi:hypothetical protein